MAPRLVRRRPLAERILEKLNPLDFLLWLSEELNSDEWQDNLREWSTIIGLALNLIFLLARANSGQTSNGDDVFADYESRVVSGWLAWFVGAQYPHCYEHDVLIIGKVFICSPLSLLSVDCKRFLHVYTKATLSPVRTINRCHSIYSIRATSACRFFTDIVFTLPLPLKHYHFDRRRISCSS